MTKVFIIGGVMAGFTMTLVAVFITLLVYFDHICETMLSVKNRNARSWCSRNLAGLWAARDQVAQDMKLTPCSEVPFEAMRQCLKNGLIPECPIGGRYWIGQPCETPRCSIHGEPVGLEDDPVRKAVLLGDYQEIKRLVEIERRSIEEKTSDGWRPLHYAAFSGKLGIVFYLLKRGADPTAKTNGEKRAYDLTEDPVIKELLESVRKP